jgi:hypothetical protein
LQEKDKIFVSSLSDNKHYELVIQFLSQRRFATAAETAHFVRGSTQTGGSLTLVLEDLETCGFIEKYHPLHKRPNSKLVRYGLADEYLRWYYYFIHPKKQKIQNGQFRNNPDQALNRKSFEIMMGFSFEHWCRKNSHLFAKILGFSGVEYEAGAFFEQNSNKDKSGFQIDLVFIIKGSKVILCEIKYYEGLVGNIVCEAMKTKMELFRESMPQYKNYTHEAVLIAPEGVKDPEAIERIFDRVITYDDIFDDRYLK